MFILRLVIPSPLRAHFDYLPPKTVDTSTLEALQPGCRVRVPFGQREVCGYLLAVVSDSDVDESKLKTALEIIDAVSLIDPSTLELCRWSAQYYQHPLGEVIGAAFPTRLRNGGSPPAAQHDAWRLTTRGKGLPPGALGRSPRQAQALTLLAAGAPLANSQFTEEGISSSVLRQLANKELIERCHSTAAKNNANDQPGNLTLNPEQDEAVTRMAGTHGQFACHLLEGVTGSGKTEVYLRLIAETLAGGDQALVLVPEIGLTPQTVGRFEARFGAGIAAAHSALPQGQRFRAWEGARSGSARVLIGTRSAIFTPFARLGLIIVDEEHDASYKQQDGFRYNARDVAVKRAQLAGCPVVLGSATPSLESIHNAMQGRYQHHRLRQRAGNAQLPAMRALDVRRQSLHGGFSESLVKTVEEHLLAQGQVLLFLNRRGYAASLQCHDCGWLAECQHCDARMTVHRRQRKLRCHHCGASSALPTRCPGCHSSSLIAAGLGTEQAEDYLRSRFGRWPIHRVDSDSMTTRDAMNSLIERLNDRQPCILLGTQMLTKGHHFPAVTLVAVLDADAALFSADFRGEERMAQLLTQVAGRAGRDDRPGQVLLQTHYPDHPSVQAILQQNYHDHARAMLTQRNAAGLPPAGFLVILRTDAADPEEGEQFLRSLRSQVEAGLRGRSTLIGPLPSPMPRRAGKFRSQLLATCATRGNAQQAAALLVEAAGAIPGRHRVNWTIDVDPLEGF